MLPTFVLSLVESESAHDEASGFSFSLVPPLWEFCCSLAMPNDGTVLRNVSGGGSVLEKTSKYRFLRCFFLLSSLLSLSSFPYILLSPSPLLFLTLSSSLSFSLYCCFFP